MQAFNDILPRLEAATGLVIRIDQAFDRVSAPAAREAAFQELKSYTPNKWIVGIDLLANERNARRWSQRKTSMLKLSMRPHCIEPCTLVS